MVNILYRFAHGMYLIVFKKITINIRLWFVVVLNIPFKTRIVK